MEIKSVILLLDSLPAGLKANIAAVLGMSLGHYYPELVGGPATTACGRELPGITTIPVPILSADETVLSEIYLTASDLDLVVPFGTAALTTKTYDDYCTRLGALTDDDQGVKPTCGGAALLRQKIVDSSHSRRGSEALAKVAPATDAKCGIESSRNAARPMADLFDPTV